MRNASIPKAIKEQEGYYDSFVEKFKPKHTTDYCYTTDDCYTPDEVYTVIRDWTVNEYGISPETRIMRPFYPGGDYEHEDYSGDCVVIDNPPFSIISKITRFYMERGVRFFLFAPNLTLFNCARGQANYVITNNRIVYENGANVNTSFVTNMGGYKVHVCPELHDIIEKTVKELQAKRVEQLPKYVYPDNVISSAILGKLACHGTELKIKAKDARWVSYIDSQKTAGKTIFGGGFLLSDRAAAERAAADRAAADRAAAIEAIKWPLSEREKAIIAELGE